MYRRHLWDSSYTDDDVAGSPNTTNVIEEVARECRRQGIDLGLYYSLWDRKQNPDVKDASLDNDYNEYMLAQIGELVEIVQRHTKIVEFWLDGGWEKPNHRWPIAELYGMIKTMAPQCQVGVNWSIGSPGNPYKHGVRSQDQKEGYPIRYFPSDFRLGDPYLPTYPDPKLFTHNGETYYMPWESTVCISGKWFYHTDDTSYKSVDELAELYRIATAQDNILILNTPPDRDGKLRERDIKLLTELSEKLGI